MTNVFILLILQKIEIYNWIHFDIKIDIQLGLG